MQVYVSTVRSPNHSRCVRAPQASCEHEQGNLQRACRCLQMLADACTSVLPRKPSATLDCGMEEWRGTRGRGQGGRCLPTGGRNSGESDELRCELLGQRGVLVERQVLALLRLLPIVSCFFGARGRGQAQVCSSPTRKTRQHGNTPTLSLFPKTPTRQHSVHFSSPVLLNIDFHSLVSSGRSRPRQMLTKGCG